MANVVAYDQYLGENCNGLNYAQMGSAGCVQTGKDGIPFWIQTTVIFPFFSFLCTIRKKNRNSNTCSSVLWESLKRGNAMLQDAQLDVRLK